MIKHNVKRSCPKGLRSIQSIIDEYGIPVFIKKTNYTSDYYAKVIRIEGGEVVCEGYYSGGKPSNKPHFYTLDTQVFYCTEEEVNTFVFEYKLPERGNLLSLNPYCGDDVPDFIPGYTFVEIGANPDPDPAMFITFTKDEDDIWMYFLQSKEVKRVKYNDKKISVQESTHDASDSRFDKLRQEYLHLSNSEDRVTICNYLIEKREVEYLVHFTPLSNIENIFKVGIAPRICMSDVEFEKTDHDRMDKMWECSSFSVSFPNYKMLQAKKSKAGKQFALLLIDVHALLDPAIEKAYFLPVNAAYHEVKGQINTYTHMKDVENMFAEKIVYKNKLHLRQSLKIPKNYTTDPQAEIMLQGIVDPKYIKGIIFETEQEVEQFSNQYPNIVESGIIADSSTELFSERRDSPFWL